MIMGNMVKSSRPDPDELRMGGICACCLNECNETGIDNSFSDSFGFVTDWGVGSDCCEAEVFEGEIFLDNISFHTARKDHTDGKIKAGQKYKARLMKGYYIDANGEHQGIYEYTKKVLKEEK